MSIVRAQHKKQNGQRRSKRATRRNEAERSRPVCICSRWFASHAQLTVAVNVVVLANVTVTVKGATLVTLGIVRLVTISQRFCGRTLLHWTKL